METVIFQVEVSKVDNKFDALIKTLVGEPEDAPYAIVQLKNNLSLNNVFYNLGINEQFKKDNEWWFEVGNDKSEEEENFFDSIEYEEQETILEKSNIEDKISNLLGVIENEEEFENYSKLERIEFQDQLDLYEKLLLISVRKVNRIFKKYSKDYTEFLEDNNPEYKIKDITDYDAQLDWGTTTGYSVKEIDKEDGTLAKVDGYE